MWGVQSLVVSGTNRVLRTWAEPDIQTRENIGQAPLVGDDILGRYDNDFNTREMETFRSTLRGWVHNTNEKVLAREPDHLAWLQSGALLAALHAYDTNDDDSGRSFDLELDAAIAGMDYTIQGAVVLDAWIKQISDGNVTADNLLWRSLTFNQEEIAKALGVALAALKDGPNDARKFDEHIEILYGNDYDEKSGEWGDPSVTAWRFSSRDAM